MEVATRYSPSLTLPRKGGGDKGKGPSAMVHWAGYAKHSQRARPARLLLFLPLELRDGGHQPRTAPVRLIVRGAHHIRHAHHVDECSLVSHFGSADRLPDGPLRAEAHPDGWAR